jgi:hypothetical protein
MAGTPPSRAAILTTFEGEAELLVLHQLDLLAQGEAQVRVVHRSMRWIERLRGGKLPVGPALTNGERITALVGLSGELKDLDHQLVVEHHCCGMMQDIVRQMQKRLTEDSLKTDGLRLLIGIVLSCGAIALLARL